MNMGLCTTCLRSEYIQLMKNEILIDEVNEVALIF